MGGFAITDFQIDKVKELHAQGKTWAQIRSEVGVSDPSISAILSGKRTKRGDPDPMPVLEKMPGAFTPEPVKRKLVRKTTVAGRVLVVTCDDSKIAIAINGQNGISVNYSDFKAMCEDAALMLETITEREKRGVYSLA
jgi:hypothetical protein